MAEVWAAHLFEQRVSALMNQDVSQTLAWFSVSGEAPGREVAEPLQEGAIPSLTVYASLTARLSSAVEQPLAVVD